MAAPVSAITMLENQVDRQEKDIHTLQGYFQEFAHTTYALISLARTLSHSKGAKWAGKCGLYSQQPDAQLKSRVILPRREQ